MDSLQRRARAWQLSPELPLPPGPRVRRCVRHPVTAVTRAARRWGVLPPSGPDPCLDRESCRQLYRQYLHECLRFREWGGCYLEVQYEEMLEAPLDVARRLAQFAGCTPFGDRLLQAAGLVQPGGRVIVGA